MKIEIDESAVRELERDGRCMVVDPGTIMEVRLDNSEDVEVAEMSIKLPYYCYSCGALFGHRWSVCPECSVLNPSERMSRKQYGEPSGPVVLSERDLPTD